MQMNTRIQKTICVMELTRGVYLALPKGQSVEEFPQFLSSQLIFQDLRLTNNPLKSLDFYDCSNIQNKYAEQVKAFFPESKMLTLNIEIEKVFLEDIPVLDDKNIDADQSIKLDGSDIFYLLEVLPGWYFQESKYNPFRKEEDEFFKFNQLGLTDDWSNAYLLSAQSFSLNGALRQIIYELSEKNFSSKILRLSIV